jgi:hypothetical protein
MGTNENAKTRNISSITLTTSTLSGPSSEPSLSHHNPSITRSKAGIMRMKRVRNVTNVLFGDCCMNLANHPNWGCFCHREPSWTIQKMKKITSSMMNGINIISSHIVEYTLCVWSTVRQVVPINATVNVHYHLDWSSSHVWRASSAVIHPLFGSLKYSLSLSD